MGKKKKMWFPEQKFDLATTCQVDFCSGNYLPGRFFALATTCQVGKKANIISCRLRQESRASVTVTDVLCNWCVIKFVIKMTLRTLILTHSGWESFFQYYMYIFCIRLQIFKLISSSCGSFGRLAEQQPFLMPSVQIL